MICIKNRVKVNGEVEFARQYLQCNLTESEKSHKT